MSEQENTYEITTINDIFKKVPLDRIEICMKEFTALLMQAKTTALEIQKAAEQSGIDVEGKTIFELPETHSWVDDNKGEIFMGISCGGDQLGSITTNVNSQTQTEKPDFYGIGDIEYLQHTKEDAIDEWFTGLSADDAKNPPSTVMLDIYKPRDPSIADVEPEFDLAMENIIGRLDEEYGNPDEETDYAPSEKTNELYEAFKKQILAEFHVWLCEKTGSIEVNLSDYITADDMDGDA